MVISGYAWSLGCRTHTVNSSELTGKRLTLLLMASTKAGEDDWAVFPGTVTEEAGRLYLERGADKPRFEIRSEWIKQIRRVAEDVKAVLKHAEYYLPLQVGAIPADADDSEFVYTGLKWPE